MGNTFFSHKIFSIIYNRFFLKSYKVICLTNFAYCGIARKNRVLFCKGEDKESGLSEKKRKKNEKKERKLRKVYEKTLIFQKMSIKDTKCS